MVFWYVLLGLLALCGTILICCMVLCGAYFFYRVIRSWHKLSDKEFYNQECD